MGLRFAAPKITQGLPTDGPDFDGYTVTPSDSADLTNGICKAIYCTVAGNVAFQLVRKDTTGNVTLIGSTTLLSVAAGEIIPLVASRIFATGTTATGIYALYR